MPEQTISIAKQVDQILRKKIFSGDYLEGHLPSESQLAADLGVSRTTIRTILVKFETEGLITRKHGQGTFVNTHVLDVNSRFNGLWDLHRLIQDGGHTPSIRKISIEKRFPSPEEAESLAISENSPIICLYRLFLADEIPVIYSANLMPFHFFSSDDIDDIDVELPIHQMLQVYFEQDISYSVSDIHSEIMPLFLKEYLPLSSGSPILRLSDIFYNLSNQPILVGENYYNDNAMKLRIARTWG